MSNKWFGLLAGCLFWVSYQFVLGQTATIDSLRQVLKTSRGIDQVDTYNQLAFEFLSYDSKKSIEAATNALQLSESIHYDKGKAASLILLSITDFSQGKSANSAARIRESIAISQRINERGLLGYGLTYLGTNFESSNRSDSALISYQQAYEILKDSLHPYYLSFLYLQMSSYYKTINDPVKQLTYMKKCWAIREQLKEKKYLVWIGEQLASYYVKEDDYNQADMYLTKAKQALGKDTIDNEEISYINKQRGILLLNQGEYAQAFFFLGKAKTFFEHNSDQQELVNIQSEIGYVFMDISDYELSLKNYFEALSRANKYKLISEQTRLLFRIAWVYYQLVQDDLSQEFVQKCLTAAKSNRARFEEASALNLLGLIADRQNKNKEAMEYFNQALTIRISINSRNGIASTLLNIGSLLEEQKKHKEALNYYLQSLSIEESTGHGIGMAYTYQSLGQLYTKLHDFKNASLYLGKAELLAKKIKAGSVLLDVLRNNRDLLVEQQKHKEAIRYSILYDNLKDSIFSKNLSSRISTLQNIFKLEQKDNEIEILNQQQELQQKSLEAQKAVIKQQTAVLVASIIVLLLVSGIAFTIYRYYRRVKQLNLEISEKTEEIQAQSEELVEANAALTTLNHEIFEQKEEILVQSEELMESNQTISELNHTLEERIEVRTAELKQAYKELDTFFYRASHDFRRPLTTFMGLAEVAKITVKDKGALELFDKVNETAHNLDKMLFKLQSISDVGSQELIYKEVFMKDIFEIELAAFKKELHAHQIQTTLKVNTTQPFYSYHGLVRIIVQNLIENSVRFSSKVGAVIDLRAYERDNEVIIEVRDNGPGIEAEYLDRVFDMYFRANEGSKGNGLGLYIVKKTVEKLDGRVELESVFKGGTTVRVYLPNKQK